MLTAERRSVTALMRGHTPTPAACDKSPDRPKDRHKGWLGDMESRNNTPSDAMSQMLLETAEKKWKHQGFLDRICESSD
jgi:hypothetical protein